MFRLASACFAFFVFTSLAACAGGTMRVVSETPSGGTVAVRGDGARDKAEQYMGAQCPFGYDILGQKRSPDDQQTIRYACRLPTQQSDGNAGTKEVDLHI